MQCLLCNSENVIIKESYSKSDLIVLWNFINIHDELPLDKIHFYKCKNCELNFFDPILAGGDKFYSELGKLEWYYLHSGKTEYDYIQNIINENDFILDIGAGRGELYNRIKKKVNYTGLELSTKAVELANLSAINVKREDLLNHSEENIEKYDVICLFQVLEHITNLNSFLQAALKCLKPGGKLCIAVPNNDEFLSFATNNTFNLPPHHTVQWNYISLKNMGDMLSLKIIDVHFEKLQDIHKNWFINEYLSNKVRKLFGIKYRAINSSFFYIVSRWLIAKIRGFKILNKIITKIVFLKDRRGHSIIITYQKNS